MKYQDEFSGVDVVVLSVSRFAESNAEIEQQINQHYNVDFSKHIFIRPVIDRYFTQHGWEVCEILHHVNVQEASP